MKPATILLFLVVSLCGIAPGQDAAPRFDWDRARALHQRAQKGETLTADEQKLYDEARRRMRAGEGPGKGAAPKGQRPAMLPAHTKPSEAAKGLVPLTELTGDYHGWDGGLYGAGSNEVPAAQQKLAGQAVAAIQPLDSDGKPSAGGKVVLMSLGMSNTTNEFSRFLPLANNDPRESASLVIVDGAQGGQTAQAWSAPDARAWSVAEQRLEAAGVKPTQVQVLWIKQANAGPKAGREVEMKRLQDDMEKVVRNAKQKYPNLRVAFLSSRIYGGYAQTALNPEPYAYEGAFAVRGLIQKQMGGDAGLNADPSKGEVKAPVLLWGPYLWAAGSAPRKSDGLAYLPEDFSGDGTHPSASGSAKVAKLLLEFFSNDPNANPWFVKR